MPNLHTHPISNQLLVSPHLAKCNFLKKCVCISRHLLLGTIQKLCHPGRGREGVSQKMILAYGGTGGVKLKLMDDDDGGELVKSVTLVSGTIMEGGGYG